MGAALVVTADVSTVTETVTAAAQQEVKFPLCGHSAILFSQGK